MLEEGGWLSDAHIRSANLLSKHCSNLNGLQYRLLLQSRRLVQIINISASTALDHNHFVYSCQPSFTTKGPQFHVHLQGMLCWAQITESHRQIKEVYWLPATCGY